MRSTQPAPGDPRAAPDDPLAHIEPRWPVAAAISIFIFLTLFLRAIEPERQSLGPRWLIPLAEVVMLVLLLLAEPTRLPARRPWLRPVALATVSLVALAVFASTLKLIAELIEGGKATNSASTLLASGFLIWLGNVLVFGLLYWMLDSGGPVARYLHERPYPDFAFAQQLSPELAPPGWLPTYVDYLVLGLTTSTAFSPTDVMPMRAWAKLTMAAQSIISLAVIGLVIARAVNIFG